jgi:hypothetical protein
MYPALGLWELGIDNIPHRHVVTAHAMPAGSRAPQTVRAPISGERGAGAAR